MKIIFGIVSSEGGEYDDFKNLWIRNINFIKNDNNYSDIFDFYFLYSDKDKQHTNMRIGNGPILYTDFYDNNILETVTESIYRRTIHFTFFLKCLFNLDSPDMYIKYNNDGFYLIRTNISTLFDFKGLFEWIQNKPKTNFFAGNFIYYNGIYTTFSGTNMIFSFDLMTYLSIEGNCKYEPYMNEDEYISFILSKLYKTIFIMNVKRLDFIEMEEIVLNTHIWPATPPSIVYQKCKIRDKDIFCFRFKTFVRKNDVILMSNVLDHIIGIDYDINKMVDYMVNNTNLQLKEEYPEYSELYSKIPFKLYLINNTVRTN